MTSYGGYAKGCYRRLSTIIALNAAERSNRSLNCSTDVIFESFQRHLALFPTSSTTRSDDTLGV